MTGTLITTTSLDWPGHSGKIGAVDGYVAGWESEPRESIERNIIRVTRLTSGAVVRLGKRINVAQLVLPKPENEEDEDKPILESCFS